MSAGTNSLVGSRATYPGGYRSTECSLLICLAHAGYITVVYLPSRFSMLAFSILAPKSTLECGGMGRRDTVMVVEVRVMVIDLVCIQY